MSCCNKSIDGIDQEEIVEIQDELRLADGTESDPAAKFTNDLNTGWYRIGSDRIGITTGGTKRFDLSSTACSLTEPLSITDTTNATTGSTGSLILSGGVGIAKDIFLDGKQTIDYTDPEALLVRKNADGGDIFNIDTTNNRITANAEYTNTGQSVVVCQCTLDLALPDNTAVILSNTSYDEVFQQGETTSNGSDTGSDLAITVGRAGKYLVLFNCNINDNGTAGVSMNLYLYYRVNAGAWQTNYINNLIVDSGSMVWQANSSFVLNLSASDVLNFRVYQDNTGSTTYVLDAGTWSQVSVIKIC